MSSHHPSLSLLEPFAKGDLDGSASCVVSAHIEHCSSCTKKLKVIEQNLSSDAFVVAAEVPSTDLNQAWENIRSQLSPRLSKAQSMKTPEIEVLGMKYYLPHALSQFTTQPLKWIPFGKGGRICKLGKENKKTLFLIYLPSNEEVPLHSHGGKEYSYVIAGNYAADGFEYQTGDFSFSSENVTHAPKAGSEDGCLLLSCVENRLNFLQSWFKPFNRAFWWLLNVRIKWM